MTRSLDLSSAESKFERAKFHAQELLEDIRIWTHSNDDPVFRIRLEDDLKHRRALAYVESIKDIPADWNLILGDALHDYRSALNYAAGALILVGRTPGVFLDPKSQFQFPICESARSDFLRPRKGNICHQLPGVPVKYLRAISPFQPYKARPNRWELWALKRLNDLDKHRKPALATHYVSAQILANPAFYGDAPPAILCTLRSLRPRGRLQPGTKLAYLMWSTDERPIILTPPYGPLRGKPGMTVYFDAAPAVVLEDLASTRTVVIHDFIDRLNALIEAVIRKLRQV